MRVLIIHHLYFPNMLGGGEYSVKLLAENIKSKGHDVVVYTLDAPNAADAMQEEVLNNVRIYRGYSKSFYQQMIKKNRKLIFLAINAINLIYNPSSNKNLKKIIAEFNPEIIHINGLTCISYWIWKYAYEHGIKVVTTLRCYRLFDPRGEYDNKFNPIVYIYKFYHSFLSNRYVNAVTSPSEKTLKIYNDHGYFKNSLQKVIVNSILYDHLAYEKCLTIKKSRRGKVRFLYAGRIDQKKGIRILIKALEKLAKNEIFLTVCGEGPLSKEIINLVKSQKNVVYKGLLTQEELISEYKNSDVLIAPSLWEEPFGRIVIEAAQYANAIIGSDRGGIPETIQALGCGETYQAENVNELVEKILRFSQRDYYGKYIENIGANLKIYSIQEQILAFERLYKNLICD